MPTTFIDQCLEFGVDPDTIEQKIEEWHNTESSLSLRDYLGFSPEEYSIWMLYPESINAILFSRCEKVPLAQAVEIQRAGGLAARALTAEEGKRIIAWLQKHL